MNASETNILKFRLAAAGLALAVLGLVIAAVSCGKSSPDAHPVEKVLYTCGMHPQVIQDKPGNCPICGMKLTPIRKQPGAATNAASATSGTTNTAAAGPESTTIAIDPVTVQNMNLRVGVVTRGPLRRTVRTVGAVDFDETALADVTTKFKGWIEKLYVGATGQQVHRGEPLFEIYSPDLVSAQTDYLLARNPVPGSPSPAADALQTSAATKLKYFDVSNEQIAELEKTRQVKKTLRVNAPRDGIVVEKMAVEGQMVDAGMKLYRLADLALVWVLSQVYEQDLPYIKLGQEAVVSLSYLADRKFRGRVTYIYPTVDEKTRTVRVRMEFHNPGFFLKPGMFATVDLRAELEPSALLVPDAAVLRSGEKNTVFVALAGGHFEPRTVTLGPRSEDSQYQVLSGLKEGEQVVTSGQFMLDSESQLREAIQKMRPSTAASVTGEQAALETKPAEQGGPESPQPPSAGKLVYICPMPEHVSLEYEKPGQCPLCGMTLVPVTQSQLAKIQPGSKVEYYTCPMPEHADVKLDKPGKCPHCGMTLIPVMEAKPPAPSPAAESPPIPSPLYTCPMASDADVVSDKPGTCPKCEMKLVETRSVPHRKAAEENWRKQHPAKPSNDSSPVHQH